VVAELRAGFSVGKRGAENERTLRRFLPKPGVTILFADDQTGLIWLLHGRRVVALTEDAAVIETATGTVAYRRHNKPALGPLGDSLDDLAPAIAANKSEATTTKHHGLPKSDDLSGPEFLRSSDV